jgi:DNA mismatch repair protein MutL
MPKIHRLSSEVIDRIAAGEVVERPASAVKELIENALDAGASKIDIEVEQGGIGRILVRDDGGGMSAEDALLSLERHATSKIASDGDLVHIAIFGFRGEALPSIASVSRLTLTTSDGASPEAVRLKVEYGRVVSREPAARPRGTDVLVEDLFARTPARRKFLSSSEAEGRAAAVAVTKAALSSPSVAFSLRSGGRDILDAPAAVDRARWIAKLQELGLPLAAIKGILRDWESADSGPEAMGRLRALTFEGARRRYGGLAPDAVTAQLTGSKWKYSDADNWRTVPSTADGWRDARADLQAAQRRLVEAIRATPPARLMEHARGPWRLFDFIVDIATHDSYHAAQIFVLRRLYADRGTHA